MKAYKTKISILLLAIVTVVLTSCYISITPLPSTITDSRLEGTFYYEKELPGRDPSDKGFYKSSYTFNGTNFARNYVEYYYFNHETWKWEISGDYIGDYYKYNFEIEVNEAKTHFRERLWNSDLSWGKWQEYKFIDNDILRIWPNNSTEFFDFKRQNY